MIRRMRFVADILYVVFIKKNTQKKKDTTGITVEL